MVLVKCAVDRLPLIVNIKCFKETLDFVLISNLVFFSSLQFDCDLIEFLSLNWQKKNHMTKTAQCINNIAKVVCFRFLLSPLFFTLFFLTIIIIVLTGLLLFYLNLYHYYYFFFGSYAKF